MIRSKRVSKRTISSYLESLNLDRHCGVLNIQTGLHCMRSLMCKSHSIASKLSVKGRSDSFHALLAELEKAKAKSKKSYVHSEFDDSMKKQENLRVKKDPMKLIEEMKRYDTVLNECTVQYKVKFFEYGRFSLFKDAIFNGNI